MRPIPDRAARPNVLEQCVTFVIVPATCRCLRGSIVGVRASTRAWCAPSGTDWTQEGKLTPVAFEHDLLFGASNSFDNSMSVLSKFVKRES